MKKALAMILALMMIFSLAACGKKDDQAATQPETSGDKTINAFFLAPEAGGPAWGLMEQGFRDACADLGWNAEYLAPTTPSVISEMVDMIDFAITNDADVMIVTIIDPDSCKDAIVRATDAGIYVLGIGGVVDECTALAGDSPKERGILTAEALVKACGDDPINVLFMQSTLQAQNQNQFSEYTLEHLLELRPDANVIGYEECNGNNATAQDKVAAHKLASPELNAVVCFDGSLGVASYVEAEGLQDSFHVVGIDPSADIFEKILNGSMDCTMASSMYANAQLFVSILAKMENGEPYDHENFISPVAVFAEDVETYAAQNGITLN